MAAFTLPLPSLQNGTEPLPNYSNLTPAQNAQITAILQANGVLPASAPALCSSAYIAAIPAANQAYAQSLCDQGQAGYNIGNAIATNNTAQLQLGLSQLPGSVSAIGGQIASAAGGALDSLLPTIPTWLWVSLGAVGVVLLIALVKA